MGNDRGLTEPFGEVLGDNFERVMLLGFVSDRKAWWLDVGWDRWNSTVMTKPSPGVFLPGKRDALLVELMAKCRSVGLAEEKPRQRHLYHVSRYAVDFGGNELICPQGGERFLFRYKSGDDDFVEANPADNFLADSDCVNVRKIPQVCLGIFLDCENPVVVGRRDNAFSWPE